MKKLVYISGTLFSMLTVLGILLKIDHWPGGIALLTLGLGGIALIFIPSLAVSLERHDNRQGN